MYHNAVARNNGKRLSLEKVRTNYWALNHGFLALLNPVVLLLHGPGSLLAKCVESFGMRLEVADVSSCICGRMYEWHET